MKCLSEQFGRMFRLVGFYVLGILVYAHAAPGYGGIRIPVGGSGGGASEITGDGGQHGAVHFDQTDISGHTGDSDIKLSGGGAGGANHEHHSDQSKINSDGSSDTKNTHFSLNGKTENGDRETAGIKINYSEPHNNPGNIGEVGDIDKSADSKFEGGKDGSNPMGGSDGGALEIGTDGGKHGALHFDQVGISGHAGDSDIKVSDGGVESANHAHNSDPSKVNSDVKSSDGGAGVKNTHFGLNAKNENNDGETGSIRINYSRPINYNGSHNIPGDFSEGGNSDKGGKVVSDSTSGEVSDDENSDDENSGDENSEEKKSEGHVEREYGIEKVGPLYGLTGPIGNTEKLPAKLADEIKSHTDNGGSVNVNSAANKDHSNRRDIENSNDKSVIENGGRVDNHDVKGNVDESFSGNHDIGYKNKGNIAGNVDISKKHGMESSSIGYEGVPSQAGSDHHSNGEQNIMKGSGESGNVGKVAGNIDIIKMMSIGSSTDGEEGSGSGAVNGDEGNHKNKAVGSNHDDSIAGYANGHNSGKAENQGNIDLSVGLGNSNNGHSNHDPANHGHGTHDDGKHDDHGSGKLDHSNHYHGSHDHSINVDGKNDSGINGGIEGKVNSDDLKGHGSNTGEDNGSDRGIGIKQAGLTVGGFGGSRGHGGVKGGVKGGYYG